MLIFWYKGTSHRYTSAGTKVKVICKGQGQISRSHFPKNDRFGGISVSQTCLVKVIIFSENQPTSAKYWNWH